MKAYILGCSHAAGAEMSKEPGLKFDNPIRADEYGYLRSYPVKIAQALGYTEIENHAIPGGSNDAMYRIFCSLPLTNKDIVFACWTGVDRTEVFYEAEQRWIQISHGVPNTHNQAKNNIAKQGINLGDHISSASEYKNYAQLWTVYEVNQWRGKLNKSKNMEALNSRALQAGIRVINIDSFYTIDHCAAGEWPIRNYNFAQWCEDHKAYRTEWGHYFESAHTDFSNYCLKFIDGQNI